MNRSGLLFGVASVLAGTTVLMVVLGLAFNPVFVVAALPFGAAAYFIWSDATGRLEGRMRSRAARAGGRDRSGGRPPEGDGPRRSGRRRPGSDGTPTREEAARTLGVDPDADGETIRRAYREAVKEAHPDAPDGDEAAFKRVQRAYDRLRE